MTIADKLSYLQDTKTAIKEALLNKGVEVSDSDTFRSYADKISSISGDSLFLPAKMAGLCFWLDGQCNTRAGNDHTKTYLENLCWNNTQSNVDGNLEYFTNTNQNVWDGDYLKLGTFAYYPYVYNTDLTIEAVIKLDSNSEGSTQCIVGNAYASGFMLTTVADAHKVRLQARLASEYKELMTKEGLEIDNVYYIVAIIKSNDKISLRINDNTALTTDFAGVLVPKTGINMGVATSANTSTNMNLKLWEGLNLGMLRIWNRALTDSEIQQNYQEAKTRFNF